MNYPTQCKCGFTKDNPNVVPASSYSFLGWMLLLIGISSVPRAILTRCDRCGTVFHEEFDPEIRKNHRYMGQGK